MVVSKKETTHVAGNVIIFLAMYISKKQWCISKFAAKLLWLIKKSTIILIKTEFCLRVQRVKTFFVIFKHCVKNFLGSEMSVRLLRRQEGRWIASIDLYLWSFVQWYLEETRREISIEDEKKDRYLSRVILR